MLRHRKIATVVIATIPLLLAAACSSNPSSSTTGAPTVTGSSDSGTATGAAGAYAAKDTYTFEVITLSNASPYWLAVKAGAEEAAKKAGNVTIQFDAPKEDTDLAQQISIFNNAVTSHVDGILLAAQNPQALVDPINKAHEAGIPVITIDSGVDPNVADSYLATDNVGAAAELATYMASLVNNSGSYSIVNSTMQFTSGIERPQGFDKGMEAISGMQNVGMQLSYSDMAKAQEQAANFMQSNPDLSMIFGANDRSAVGVCNAIKAAGKGGKVLMASFDVNDNLIECMRDGILQASVLQSPYDMGTMGVENLLKIYAGEAVEKTIATPVFILKPDNLDSQDAITAIQQYMPDYKG